MVLVVLGLEFRRCGGFSGLDCGMVVNLFILVLMRCFGVLFFGWFAFCGVVWVSCGWRCTLCFGVLAFCVPCGRVFGVWLRWAVL